MTSGSSLLYCTFKTNRWPKRKAFNLQSEEVRKNPSALSVINTQYIQYTIFNPYHNSVQICVFCVGCSKKIQLCKNIFCRIFKKRVFFIGLTAFDHWCVMCTFHSEACSAQTEHVYMATSVQLLSSKLKRCASFPHVCTLSDGSESRWGGAGCCLRWKSGVGASNHLSDQNIFIIDCSRSWSEFVHSVGCTVLILTCSESENGQDTISWRGAYVVSYDR